MNKFFCPSCAQDREMPPIPTSFYLTGTRYQQVKLDRHTCPPSSNDEKISIFDNSASDHISGLMSSALHSGWIAQDVNNRESVVLSFDERIGSTHFATGQQIDSALRIVCYDNSKKIHAYPTASDEIVSAICADCGTAYNSY